MLTAGILLLALAILFASFPRLLMYPLTVVFMWVAVALLYKGYKLRRESERESATSILDRELERK
ncbi:MAG: hypothetical protein M3416_02395 [Acidobacteriota bacterium]|nr:hypothetical protein [Acidobacteriota bacterium]